MCMVYRGPDTLFRRAVQRVCDILYLHSSESRIFVRIWPSQFLHMHAVRGSEGFPFPSFAYHSSTNEALWPSKFLWALYLQLRVSNMTQTFSSHWEWKSLETIVCCTLAHGTTEALPQDAGDLLEVHGSCSSSGVLQQSLPTQVKGQFKEKQVSSSSGRFFLVNISTFLKVCVPNLLQTWMHQH